MQNEATAFFPRLTPRAGIFVADGYGIRLYVERGRLVVSDGIGTLRRVERFARATVPFGRLVVLGHTGYVSFDAIRWLADLGRSFVQIDTAGRVLGLASPTGPDDPRLRRAQARAAGTPIGIEASRLILRAKIRGQLEGARHDASHRRRGDRGRGVGLRRTRFLP